MENPRAEAKRLLGISEKLLQNRDLVGSRKFAILAQETEPLLEGSNQILAIIDILLAAEKHVKNPDWYAILQVDRRSNNLDLIKRQYRRLALLLHPDKSRFHFTEDAFNLVTEAWALLSDPIKKSIYDNDLSFNAPVDLSVPSFAQGEKLPVRRAGHIPAFGSNLTIHNHGIDPRIMSASSAREKIAAEENSRRRFASVNLTIHNHGINPQTMSGSAAKDKIAEEENSQRRSASMNHTIHNHGIDPQTMSSSSTKDKIAAEENSHKRSASVNLTIHNHGIGQRTMPGSAARDKIATEENLRRRSASVNHTIHNHGIDPQTLPSSAAKDKTVVEETSPRRSASMTFWTACPYCYRLYEYPKAYEGCCLRCQNCERSFHGVAIMTLPPLVPGQDAYYCCWGFFPMEFVVGNAVSGEKETSFPVETMPAHVPESVPAPPMMQTTSSLPNWMPVPSENDMSNVEPTVVVPTPAQMTKTADVPKGVASVSGPRKRKRSRKYPVAF